MEIYKKVMWGSIVIAALIAVLLIIYFFFVHEEPGSHKPTPDREKAESKPLPTPPVEEVKKPVNELPLDTGLEESDTMVRELLEKCSSHPGFAKWLKNSDLIRKSVAVADNIANGESPAAHLESLLPAEKFKIIKKNNRIYIDPGSYKRYNLSAAIFSSLNSEMIVSLYRRSKFLVNESFKDLGYPEQKFDNTLQRAIKMLLDVPIIEKDILLEEKVTTYIFSDPKLERLNPAQKHLLRMGPENIKKIQAKLREIAALLER